MHALGRDCCYALARLRRSPGLVCAVVLSLGLGIGATAALFSVVDAIDFRLLPYHDATHVVMLREIPPAPAASCRDCGTSFSTYLDWRRQTRSYSAIAAQRMYVRQWWHDDPTGGGTEFLTTANVSPEFFGLLGVAPSLGRGIGIANAAPDAEHVAVLADEFWRRQFHADRRVIGRQITFIPFGIDQPRSYTIVGVMRPGFHFLDAMVWMPLVADPTASRADHSLQVIARLKPDITIGRANAELETVADRLAQEYPSTNRGWRAHVVPLRSALITDFGSVGGARLLLLALVATLLLVASANVATLLLVRAERRSMEFAVRRALGASSWRLVAQSGLESAFLAAGGCAAALGLAVLGVPALGRGLGLARAGLEARMDTRVIAFALATGVVVCVLCAVLPARRAALVSIASLARERAPPLPGFRHVALARVLVSLEIATALVAVTATALLSRDLFRLEHRDLAFDANGLYQITARMPATWVPDAGRRREFVGLTVARIGSVPGVFATSVYAPALTRPHFQPNGMPAASLDARPLAVSIGPDFFATMRISIIAGRGFTAADNPHGLPVVVASRAAVAAYWNGQNPVGSQVLFGDSGGGTRATVVGIAEDARFLTSVNSPAPVVIYRPFDQAPEQQVILVARAANESAAIESALRAALRTITTGPIDRLDVAPIDRFIGQQLRQQHFNQVLLVAFAILGLVLALVGAYGTVAYAISQRSRELGIRSALGAQPADLLILVSRDGMTATAVGAAVGIPAAVVFGRLVQALVVRAGPVDPLVVLGSAILVLTLVMLAGFIAARRAGHVDPCRTLMPNG